MIEALLGAIAIILFGILWEILHFRKLLDLGYFKHLGVERSE